MDKVEKIGTEKNKIILQADPSYKMIFTGMFSRHEKYPKFQE